jgi:predicted PurR-regulated permease PerM
VLEPIAFLYIVAGLLLSAALFGLVRAASAALTTIAVGIILALAVDPLVSAIRRRWHWSRTAGVLFVMAGVAVVAVVLVVEMAPRAAEQARGLSSDLPNTVREFYDLPIVGSWLEDRDAATEVDEAVKKLPSQVSDESITTAVDTLMGGAMTALLVLAVSLAVLLDGERLVQLARRLVPAPWVDRADEVGRVTYMAIARYFGGSVAVAGLMGAYVLTLCLLFGVPLAPLAAVWAMLMDLVPQVGGFLGGALLGLLALTQGPIIFVVVIGLYVLYMNLENHVISPAIIGPAVNVTPPTAMLAVLIGGAAGGVPGALVATPLTGAVKQLYLRARYGTPVAFTSSHPGSLTRVRSLLRRRPRPTKAT